VPSAGGGTRDGLANGRDGVDFGEYARHDAVALADLVRRRQVTPAELLALARARAEAVGPHLGCVSIDDGDFAEAHLARGVRDGPFAGVPLLLKDLYAFLAGTRISNGSRLVRDWTAPSDATLVVRLLAAGFVPFAKTTSPEFGLNVVTEPVLHGACRNPWDPAFSPGGSSGGAAAAVAAGVVPVAHASDGGGSIRIPASHCGLVGLKPSRARTPVGPAVGEVWSGLAVGFVLTRTVRDAAAVLDVLAGPEPGDLYASPEPGGRFADALDRDPGRLRIGLLRRPPHPAVRVHPEVAAVVEAAADFLDGLGHAVEETDVPLDGARFAEAFLAVVAVNVARDVAWWSRTTGRPADGEHLETATLALVERGRALSAVAFLEALRTVQGAARALGRVFARFDLLLSPVCALPPPRVGEIDQNGPDPEAFLARNLPYVTFTHVYNAAGCPALALPFGRTGAGLPVGIMLGAPLGAETRLLALAAVLERARPWPRLAPFAPPPR